MKNLKKLSALLLAFALIAGFIAPVAVYANGQTGSITITTTSKLTVKGKTFDVYKILDITKSADNSAMAYVVPTELRETYNTVFGLGVDVNATDFDEAKFNKDVLDKIEPMTPEQVREMAEQIIATGGLTPIANKTATEDTLKFEDLELGYYIVKDVSDVNEKDSALSAVMVDTTNTDLTITLKGDKPTIEKKINGDEDSDGVKNGLVDSDEVAIGDMVPYVITTAIPDHEFYREYGKFIIQDKMSKGLTFDKSTLKVFIGDEINPKELGKDYTLETENLKDGVTFQVKILNVKSYDKDTVVKLTYSARLNEEAAIGEVGNPNGIRLIYSNDPDWTSDGTPGSNEPEGITPWDRVITYVTELKIIKTDGDIPTKVLANAEFKLTGTRLNTVLVEKSGFTENPKGTYYKLIDGTYTETAPTPQTKDKYASTTVKYTQEYTLEKTIVASDATITGISDDDGIVRFVGLAAGTYTLDELKAPNGYNMLSKPIIFTIKAELPAKVTTDEKCTWSGTYKIGQDGDVKVLALDKVNNITEGLELEVKNFSGTVLPETGGMGTTILYVIGSLLAIGAAVVLVTRKVVSNK